MKVIFDLEFFGNTNKILYPDDIAFFSNTVIKNNKVIADYNGSLNLTEYQEPEKIKVTIQNIKAKNENESSFLYYDSINNFISVKTGVVFLAECTIENFPIDDIWNTPLLRNGVIEGYAKSWNSGQNLSMEGSFVVGGKWQITQEAINDGLPEEWHFIFPEITAKVYS